MLILALLLLAIRRRQKAQKEKAVPGMKDGGSNDEKPELYGDLGRETFNDTKSYSKPEMITNANRHELHAKSNPQELDVQANRRHELDAPVPVAELQGS